MSLRSCASPSPRRKRPAMVVTDYATRSVMLLAGVLLLTLLFSLTGCDREPAVPVDLTRRAEIQAPENAPAITYAYLPQYSHTTSFMRHGQLVEYLQKSTGLPIRQVFPDTFEAHLRMVERGEIDISFSNPVAYVALAQSGAIAFARIVEPSGKPSFRGQIICRAEDNSLRTLADCKGKRWIAVDPLSAGGFLFALGAFHDAGLKPSDFAELAFAPGPGGKQEKAVLGVYTGRYDIASIREGTLDVMAAKYDADSLRILATTPEYPSWVYAARKGLAPDTVRRIADALFHLSTADPEHDRILEAAGMKGIIPATDSDYASVRSLMNKLGVDPAKVGAE